MQIYKFGGASVKNTDALRNVSTIVANQSDLIIVVSAIDKTTNKLEKLVESNFKKENNRFKIWNEIKQFHIDFVNDAFDNHASLVIEKLNVFFAKLDENLNSEVSVNYDLEYDKIVSFGELFSSTILSEYLNFSGVKNTFLDIREGLVTDSNFRDAKILWEESESKLKSLISIGDVFITQGFIGRDKNREYTTLGREGSDYTASALAYILDAESVTIWKDVPGIMNADPAWCDFAQKLDFLSYREAIELAFFGAKVIHPKTIKPIENKHIPLYVKSFDNPQEKGTVIKKLDYKLELIPVYILKSDQVLISITPKDFSFVVEENMSKIFGLFADYKIKVNITQNSAISFSASIDGGNRNFEKLISDLAKDYFVKYNCNLELLTIRYYNDNAINRMMKGRKVLMEQRNRTTARFVLGNKETN